MIWGGLGIVVQQKHQQAQTLQLSSYQDMLQQTLAWLDTMEKQTKLDTSSWTSIQDVRGKLLKQKTSLQEIVPYKRVVDGKSRILLLQLFLFLTNYLKESLKKPRLLSNSSAIKTKFLTLKIT